jgi:hypothetical protein
MPTFYEFFAGGVHGAGGSRRTMAMPPGQRYRCEERDKLRGQLGKEHLTIRVRPSSCYDSLSKCSDRRCKYASRFVASRAASIAADPQRVGVQLAIRNVYARSEAVRCYALRRPDSPPKVGHWGLDMRNLEKQRS